MKRRKDGCPETLERRAPGRNSACAVGASRPRSALPRRSPRGRAWRHTHYWEAGRREQPHSLVDLRVDEGVMTDTSLLTGWKHVLLSRTRSKECPTLLTRSRSRSEARDPPAYLGGSTARGVYRGPLAVLSSRGPSYRGPLAVLLWSSRNARACCAPEGSRQHARAQPSRVAGREWHARARAGGACCVCRRVLALSVLWRQDRERARRAAEDGGRKVGAQRAVRQCARRGQELVRWLGARRRCQRARHDSLGVVTRSRS
jgi:hypothetical protein